MRIYQDFRQRRCGYDGDSCSSVERLTTSDSRVKRTLKFSVIGVNHDRICAQVEAARRGGGELLSFYAKEPELAVAFSKHYPDVKLASSEKEVLEDPSIKLI